MVSIVRWTLETSLLVTVLVLMLSVSRDSNLAQAARKRCFACRSRGPLGDCKDPFAFNSTLDSLYGSSPVEAQPCASGWCGKTLEDEDEGAHIMATERMCLQRPPPDGKERCSKTFFSNRRKTFYMCFCKGDLCNGSSQLPGGLSLSTLFSMSGLVVFFTLNVINNH